MANCIFCKIINKEIESNIILENEKAIAFLDMNPVTSGHILVIPKKHCVDLTVCFKEDLNAVLELVQKVSRLLESSKLAPFGMNFLSNQGEIAGQVVKHFHMHVIPKYNKDKGFVFQKVIDEQSDQDLEAVKKILKKAYKKNNKFI